MQNQLKRHSSAAAQLYGKQQQLGQMYGLPQKALQADRKDRLPMHDIEV